VHFEDSVAALAEALAGEARAGDQILIMSNGGFDGLHGKLLAALRARHEARRAAT
jgi:UDP-N-acetylmuramate: L-alanyl-gamma-D-glutamyl-meso-diaminopimelate ligase